MNGLSQLRDELHNVGYKTLTLENTHVSGVIHGVDVSNASKSIPDGEDTGPFRTLDSTEEIIPSDIKNLCEQYDKTLEVLGHGPNRLHIHIS